jgi:hypothetical protein
MARASHKQRRLRAARVSALLFALLAAAPGGAQDRVSEFRQLASQIVQRRLGGLEENEADHQRALELLDALALEPLNAAAGPDAEAATRALQSLLPQPPPVGEEYRLLRMGTPGTPWFLLQANFGLAGPSALRLYAQPGNGAAPYRLAARIDRFAQPEYFDEFLAVAPVSPEEGVFLTVTGRTDELETGSFTAWRFDGAQLQRLWATDLLERSRYELSGMEFRLTYCQETDEDDLRKCVLMVRERYTWRRGWHLLERREVQP